MATLKISELSVGDWVKVILSKCDYDESDAVDAKVLSIEGNSVGVGYDNSGIFMSALVEDLQPIPITAEVLEKNGFVKSDDFLHKIDLPDNILLGVRRQTDGYIFELKREKRRIGELLVIIRGIRNIHQLQHALRLAGVDKEINL